MPEVIRPAEPTLKSVKKSAHRGGPILCRLLHVTRSSPFLLHFPCNEISKLLNCHVAGLVAKFTRTSNCRAAFQASNSSPCNRLTAKRPQLAHYLRAHPQSNACPSAILRNGAAQQLFGRCPESGDRARQKAGANKS